MVARRKHAPIMQYARWRAGKSHAHVKMDSEEILIISTAFAEVRKSGLELHGLSWKLVAQMFCGNHICPWLGLFPKHDFLLVALDC